MLGERPLEKSERTSFVDFRSQTEKNAINFISNVANLVILLFSLLFVLNVILKVKVLVNSIHGSKAKRANECHYST